MRNGRCEHKGEDQSFLPRIVLDDDHDLDDDDDDDDLDNDDGLNNDDDLIVPETCAAGPVGPPGPSGGR